jgi:hypothetical protein
MDKLNCVGSLQPSLVRRIKILWYHLPSTTIKRYEGGISYKQRKSSHQTHHRVRPPTGQPSKGLQFSIEYLDLSRGHFLKFRVARAHRIPLSKRRKVLSLITPFCYCMCMSRKGLDLNRGASWVKSEEMRLKGRGRIGRE